MSTRTKFLTGYAHWDKVRTAPLPAGFEILIAEHPLLFDASQEDEQLAVQFDEYERFRILTSKVPAHHRDAYNNCMETLNDELHRLKNFRDHPGYGTGYLRCKMHLFLLNNYHQPPAVDGKIASLLARKVGINAAELIAHLHLSRKREWAGLYYQLSEQRLRFVRQLGALGALHLKLHALLQSPSDPRAQAFDAHQSLYAEPISVNGAEQGESGPRVFSS